MAKEKTDTLDVENEAVVDKEKVAEDTGKQTDAIPKERLDALIAENKALADRLKMQQDQFDLMRANMPQPQPAAEPKEPDILDGVFTSDDTIVDKKQLEVVIKRLQQENSDLRTHVNNLAGQFMVQQQNPNFQQVIAEHLPEILKTDPTLFPLLQGIHKLNPALAGATAYRLATTSPTYLEKQNKAKTAQADSEKINLDIQELLKNRKMPQSISALGSGGGTAGSSGSPLLDKMMELEKPEDFNKFVDELKSGAVKLSKL